MNSPQDPINKTEQVMVEKWLRTVRASIGSLGLVGILVFVLGIGLLLLGDSLTQNLSFTAAVTEGKLWLEVLREVGLAFIVAAIAVFGYEHLHHATRTFEQQRKLEYEVMALTKLRQQEEERASGEALTTLDTHLGLIFPNREHDHFRAAVSKLLMDVAKIRGKADSMECSKESAEYIKYVAWLVQKFGGQEASNLAQLLNRMGGSYEFTPPDRREVARRILIAQMNCMGEGDGYDSIASVFLYAKDGGQMSTATEQAVERGLKVQRIFNVSVLEEDPQRLRGKHYSNLQSLIQAQEDLSRRCPDRFAIRFFGRAAFAHVDDDLIEEARVQRRELDKTYYGLFTRRDGESLLFRADTDDPTLLTLRYCGDRAEDGEQNGLSRLFVHLWTLCDDAPNPFQKPSFDPKWGDNRWGQ